jgi:trk system potassium uptake protein TrkH
MSIPPSELMPPRLAPVGGWARGPRYEVSVLRALLWTIAPLAVVVWFRYHGLPWPMPAEVRVADIGWATVAILFARGAAIVPHRGREGRWTATLAIILASGLLVHDLWNRPAVAFPLLVGACGLLVRIWPRKWSVETAPQRTSLTSLALEARASAIVALLAWIVAVPAEWTARRSSAAALAGVIAVAWVFALRWGWLERKLGGRRWTWLAGAGIAAWGTGLVQWHSSALIATAPLVIAPIATLVVAIPKSAPVVGVGAAESLAAVLLDNPARFLLATFAGFGLWGGAVIGLPFCTVPGVKVGFLDAIFTAVSASCSVGLEVVDVGRDLTFVGQLVVLILVQAGALGIMSFAAAALALLARRAGNAGEIALLGAEGRGGVRASVRRVFAVTFAIEGAGAIVLAYLFRMSGAPLGDALWSGIFTAVSAFCNAGFTVSAGSLASTGNDPLILGTVASLVVLGGLGPAVVAALPEWFRGNRPSVHARLTLLTTAVLLVAPAVMFALFEAQESLKENGFLSWLVNAAFLSVTARTGGFTTFDLNDLHPASAALLIGLMFVGGGTGSAAGGVKVTTLALAVLAVIASVRGQKAPSVFGRRVPATTLYRATAITAVALGVVGAGLTAILATQDLTFEQALFEVVSALGTVGLTLGGTARLDEIGKVVIIVCMFLGRTGPLAMFLTLAEIRRIRAIGLPEEDVVVG